ncbi:MAG: ABC transporter permease [Candidatus Methanomethylicaceae archaeon]
MINLKSLPGRFLKYRYILLSYPLAMLFVFFLLPLGALLVSSFYINVPGAFYKVGFTFENYIRFFTNPFYLRKMWFTIEMAFIVAVICLFVGYPVAYYLTRLRSGTLRNLCMITMISTLWLTYIVRAYAWRIILAGVGPLNKFLMAIGVFDEPHNFAPGYGAVVIGLTYVFLPFAILSLYSSISKIEVELEEASLSLGANRFKTFVWVILPLSKGGIISAFLLVFVLALGAYVTPKILGNPPQWPIAIFIGDIATDLMNIPLSAAMSIVLITIVLGSLGLMAKLTRMMGSRGR